MDPQALFLGMIVLGCICISLMNITKRGVQKPGGINLNAFLAAQFGVTASLYAVAYLIFYGLRLPSVAPYYLVAIIGCAAANLFIQWLGAKVASLEAGEVSVTAPLQAMTPMMITLTALILKEFPGWRGILGILFMASGSYYLTWPKQRESWLDWAGPIGYLLKFVFVRKDASEPNEKKRRIAILLSLLSAALGTFGLLFESLYIHRGGGSWQGMMLGSGTVCALMSLTYLLGAITGKAAATDPKARRRFIWGFLALDGLFFAHWMFIQPGFMHFFTAYVGTLKRLSILLSVLLGIWVLKEAPTRAQLKQRLWAAGLITAGSIFIGWDGLSSRTQAAFESLF